MHKSIAKLMFVLFLTSALLSACTADSNEPDKPVATAKAGEVTEVEKVDDCVIVVPEQPVACTMQYDPVCGCDGNTYGNACMARGAGVPSSEPGECGKNPNQ